jgi:hypothetical protein
MQHHTRPIAILLLTSAIIDGIIICFVDQQSLFRGSPDFFGIALLALMLSQTSLVSIWMAMGRAASSLRMLCAVGVILLLSCSPLFVSHNYHGRVVFLLGVGGIVAISLLAARACGLRCVHDLDHESDEAGGRKPWQFSIVQLLIWTTALAVVLGLFKWARFFDAFSPDLSMSLAGMVFLGPSRALVTFAALWMMLGRGAPIRRVPALVIAEIASLGLPSVLFKMPSAQEIGILAWFMALEAAVFVGSLLVFRKIGYRVRWSRRAAATESRERLPDVEEQADIRGQ